MQARATHSASGEGLARGITLCAVLLLGACGFHLRGAAPLPAAMAVTSIQGTSEYSSLYDDFRTALESHGARVTADRGKATAILTILKNDTGTDVLSVNLAGKVLEYRLWQDIEFEVTAADGRTLIGQQSVMMNRAVKFNVKGVLGYERERETIRGELQRDVVNLAMLRITAAAGH